MSSLAAAAPEAASKEQAVDIATQIYPGRVLSVKHESNTYQVKILNDNGKIKIIHVDGQNGKANPGTGSKPDR